MAYNILNSSLNPIDQDQCIGDTLDTFNVNFSALDTSISRLSAALGNVPAAYNDTNLYTLINTLSTNMKNIGNYPYLEYAWVTAPNTAGQAIASNTITTLTLNTEVADTGNFGSLASNQITLAAGTYQFEAFVYSSIGSANGGSVFGLRRVSNSTYITRTGSRGGWSDDGDYAVMKGQFTLTTSDTLDLTWLPFNNCTIYNSRYNNTYTNSTANADQRTTIKLWKVG